MHARPVRLTVSGVLLAGAVLLAGCEGADEGGESTVEDAGGGPAAAALAAS
jgi:hypothetical protein